MISAHRIDCDLEIGHEELFLGCLDDFPLFVIAAMRTSTMRHAYLVAVRTLGTRPSSQMSVRPPAVAPGLRMSSFWIWHILLAPLFQPPFNFNQGVHMRIEILRRTSTATGI